MKHSVIIFLALFTLSCLYSCSSDKGTPIFGEDLSQASFEEGSWEIRDNVLVAFEFFLFF